MKTHTSGDVRYWYDRSTRCWWAARYDSGGNQIGDAVHAATKSEILFAIETTLKETAQ
jgi:hypothetical protein